MVSNSYELFLHPKDIFHQTTLVFLKILNKLEKDLKLHKLLLFVTGIHVSISFTIQLIAFPRLSSSGTSYFFSSHTLNLFSFLKQMLSFNGDHPLLATYLVA